MAARKGKPKKKAVAVKAKAGRAGKDSSFPAVLWLWILMLWSMVKSEPQPRKPGKARKRVKARKKKR